jgi:hypothetical protein
MTIAGIAMAVGSYFSLLFLQNYLDVFLRQLIKMPNIFYSLFDLCLVSIVAVLIYVSLTIVFRCSEVDFYKDYVLKRLNIRKKHEN